MEIRREILVRLLGSDAKLKSLVYDFLQEIWWLRRSFLGAEK